MLLKPRTYSGLNVLYKSRVIELNSLTITSKFDGIQMFLSSSAVTTLILKLGYTSSKYTTRRIYEREQVISTKLFFKNPLSLYCGWCEFHYFTKYHDFAK